jgi:hypothetical protein
MRYESPALFNVIWVLQTYQSVLVHAEDLGALFVTFCTENYNGIAPRFLRVRYFGTLLYGNRPHCNRATVTPDRGTYTKQRRNGQPQESPAVVRLHCDHHVARDPARDEPPSAVNRQSRRCMCAKSPPPFFFEVKEPRDSLTAM